VALTVIRRDAGSPPAAPSCRTPPLTVVPPVYVLGPLSVTVPDPSFVSPPSPLMAPASVLAVPVLVTVRPVPVWIVPAAVEFTLVADKLTEPLNAAGPFTWITSPASLPVRMANDWFRCALSALVIVIVSVPATAVVSIVTSEALCGRAGLQRPRRRWSRSRPAPARRCLPTCQRRCRPSCRHRGDST
jgi:hypothetical protein